MSRTHEKRTNKTEVSETAMTTALEVADFFLSTRDDEAGDFISNLKLQKLLYYAQGYYVALHGVKKPLFSDTIYAWQHGPVVSTVYKKYNKSGAEALPKRPAPKLAEDTLMFLQEINRSYGRFSAWALREMTHRETPWLKNYKAKVEDIEIPLKDLADFFKGKISHGKAH